MDIYYCTLNDNSSILVRVIHQYYHQVQLQLFVGLRGATFVFILPKESSFSVFSSALILFKNLKNIMIAICFLKLFLLKTSHLTFRNFVHMYYELCSTYVYIHI